jgi:hypothetical protein
VLNGDFRPMSVSPLMTMAWEDSIRGAIAGSHIIVSEYDQVVRSPAVTMRIPSVIAVKEYVDLNRPASKTRWNVMLLKKSKIRSRLLVCAEIATIKPLISVAIVVAIRQ